MSLNSVTGRRHDGVMASSRAKLVHVCSECGTSHPKWSGRCSGCGDWNTLVEDVEVSAAVDVPVAASSRPGPTPIGEVGKRDGGAGGGTGACICGSPET